MLAARTIDIYTTSVIILFVFPYYFEVLFLMKLNDLASKTSTVSSCPFDTKILFSSVIKTTACGSFSNPILLLMLWMRLAA
jgi:hypothetical protein